MDEKKRYGILTALGKAIGEQAKEDAGVLKELKAVTDVDGLEQVLVKYRGNVPEAIAREFAQSVDPDGIQKDRARLVLQAKMTMQGQAPVSGRDAERGAVTGK